ncbi:MAG: hypothetical protein ABI885_01350 [Gammaproteobacteria bacterium]
MTTITRLTTQELLGAIKAARAAKSMHRPESEEWRLASGQLDALFTELRSRTSSAAGSAFSATLLGVPQRDLDVTGALGERLLIELRKRGFTVFPSGDPSMM